MNKINDKCKDLLGEGKCSYYWEPSQISLLSDKIIVSNLSEGNW